MLLQSSSSPTHIIGLMSGTSLDGVDGVLACFPIGYSNGPVTSLATAYIPFAPDLREELLALQVSGPDEIHREAMVANVLARLYAACVEKLLEQAQVQSNQVHAIGVHGQTIRHRPGWGYTHQTNNPALLAELTGIDVIANFRERDLAAGGQGAPLVPAFHQAIFSCTNETRVVANIGGISNISVLDNCQVVGFDTGPGNVLMDAWIKQHRNKSFDEQGNWAANGKVIPALLDQLLTEPFFKQPPPKSSGRDLFHLTWLSEKLSNFYHVSAVDIQATLAELTATTLADAIAAYCRQAKTLYVCGGGAYNDHLMALLQDALKRHSLATVVDTTEALGVPPNHVEAMAFAWLAYQFINRQPGNLSSVTGAKGPRILGALYPA